MTQRGKPTPGPQRHAEGQQGEKTRRRFVEQLAGGSPPDMDVPSQPPSLGAVAGARPDGHHRLHEDRTQHDEAEKASEKTRAIRRVAEGETDEALIKHARVNPARDTRP